jgi:isoleucyl-tRNA synthetase
MPYPTTIPNQSIPQLEERVLEFWQREQIFKKSVEQRPVDNQFVLYDGPPFATGLPHYGHVLAHSIKDVLPRYQTMRGKRVERRFGWDCHGVPVEYQVEQELKLNGKKDIEAGGIANFNEACRSIVQKYTKEWRYTEDRLGRFVDMDNDYKTMDLNFMESVWAVFKKINDKNLVYEGKKVVAYSPELGTPLSDFESKLNYKTISDPEVVLAFPLVSDPAVSLLVWTTTPWSVPANVAIAVNPALSYVKITTADDKQYIVAESTARQHFKKGVKTQVSFDINSILGQAYEALFIEGGEANANCFKIISSDHVTDSDGTGLVHIAPAFGEDDYRLGMAHQLPVMDYFDNNGRFKEDAPVAVARGLSFKDADKAIIEVIKAKGKLFHHGTFHHEYPFCWRTDKPLMYRAVSSWYVKVTAIKSDILANNEKINWYPDHVGKKRFKDWLTNARDWAISRSRYWGTPIPIWRNTADENDYLVLGSIAELQQYTDTPITDLHRHCIDDLKIEKDGKVYQRIPEVFDCWFESGAMPYAQAHYPFENAQQFESTFPADFIAEGLDQTRGWFYTLMVLSTALFNKPAFKNCMVNGILLGDDGKKMSKSKRNYPPINDVFAKYGADPLRFLLLRSGATQAQEMRVSEDKIKEVTRQVLLPILHILTFFADKANKNGFQPETAICDTPHLSVALDQWLFYATEHFKERMQTCFDNYDLVSACQEVVNYIEQFSKLYVRNSKLRLKTGSSQTQEGLVCMHHALTTLSKCIAPLTPFMGDILYQALFGNTQSVHLQEWPALLNKIQYQNAFNSIEICRTIIRLANSVRQENNIELKQPLISITLSDTLRETLQPHMDMLKEALNVENIIWLNGSASDLLKTEITLNEKALGPKYRNALKSLRSDFIQGKYSLEADVLTVGSHQLSASEFTITYKPNGNVRGAVEGPLWMTLDCELTADLAEKGRFRRLQREIQVMRKTAALTSTDTITLTFKGDDEFLEFIRKYQNDISQVTHAVLEFEQTSSAGNTFAMTRVNGEPKIQPSTGQASLRQVEPPKSSMGFFAPNNTASAGGLVAKTTVAALRLGNG